jgi:hypothetical protein
MKNLTKFLLHFVFFVYCPLLTAEDVSLFEKRDVSFWNGRMVVLKFPTMHQMKTQEG